MYNNRNLHINSFRVILANVFFSFAGVYWLADSPGLVVLCYDPSDIGINMQ